MLSYSILKDIKSSKVAFIAMILLVILGIELGLWQLRRAEYKEQLAMSVAVKKREYWI
jgi:cytochrome oxidase assembly protein ShyY1